jgi:hypothetical protein
VLGLLEVNEDVVPAERDPSFLLQFGVEDVDQREGGLEEGSLDDELLSRSSWASDPFRFAFMASGLPAHNGGTATTVGRIRP